MLQIRTTPCLILQASARPFLGLTTCPRPSRLKPSFYTPNIHSLQMTDCLEFTGSSHSSLFPVCIVHHKRLRLLDQIWLIFYPRLLHHKLRNPSTIPSGNDSIKYQQQNFRYPQPTFEHLLHLIILAQTGSLLTTQFLL